MIPEETILDFAASAFNSVWSLETLLALKRDPSRLWTAGDLIRELRSSEVVVAAALSNLVDAGLVLEQANGRYRYHASSTGFDEIVNELQKVYGAKPTAVVRAIVTTSNRKLKILSDAFRFKK